MPPLTMQEEGLTRGTSCPFHCPSKRLMYCVSCTLFLLSSLQKEEREWRAAQRKQAYALEATLF